MADKASSPAFRACTKGSLRDLVKAATSTFDRVYTPELVSDVHAGKVCAYTVAQILGNSAEADSCVGTDARLFVIGGACQVFEQFAVNNPITELVDDGQDSLDGLLSNDGRNVGEAGSLDRVRKARMLVNRKGLTICGKILSLTTFWGRLSIIRGKLSNRQTRRARSGFPNRRTTTGVNLALNSSGESLDPIFRVAPRTLGPPPPNSTDLSNSGSTFILKKSSGKSSERPSSSLQMKI